MIQNWIWILVIMMFYQNMPTGVGKEVPVVEGQPVQIRCHLETTSIIVWLRVLDGSGIHFIASYSYYGPLKSSSPNFFEIFNSKSSNQKTLMLKAFNGRRDSGLYSCGSLIKGNELKFGEVTRLFKEQKKPRTEFTTKATPGLTNVPSVTAPCLRTNENDPGLPATFLFCTPFVLIPLVSACAFLLLLLLITILYCNRIRTRRCPHHHKRKLGAAAPLKQNKRPV